MLPTRSLVPETAYESDPPRYRSREKLPRSAVSAGGTCLGLVPLVVGLSAVVVFVEEAVVVVVVAAAVALGSGELGGQNRSVLTQGTAVENSGSW